jgi:hypothetical protein
VVSIGKTLFSGPTHIKEMAQQTDDAGIRTGVSVLLLESINGFGQTWLWVYFVFFEAK